MNRGLARQPVFRDPPDYEILKPFRRFKDLDLEYRGSPGALDPTTLKADMETPEIAERLARNQELAVALGIQSTLTVGSG